MATTSLNCKSKLLRKSKGSGKDWISNLPNELLCQILWYLSTKDSVRTSILSKRWRNLWLHVPALELDTDDFTDDCDFWEFFGKVLELKEELKRFKLVYIVGEHFHEDFVPRIDGVIKRRVCHLSVLNMVDDDEALVRMPLSLYSCVTLASLVLYGVVLDAPVSNLVFLPHLKTMHLEAVKFDGKSLLGNFISRCSVLEDLSIVTHHGDYLGVVRVSSQSLKSFKLKSERSYAIEYEDEDPDDPSVIIEAPRLEFMSITDYQSKSFIIYNIGLFAKVNIDFIFKVNHGDSLGVMISNFLTTLSTVHEMTISDRTLEMIHENCEMELLPQFANMSHLHASFLQTSWKMLLPVLGCCPNLQSLDLDFYSFMPQCFQSSLEFVNLCTPVKVEGTSSEMKLPILFLRNCKVMKKLMLSESFKNVIKKVRGIPKRSPQFQAVSLS